MKTDKFLEKKEILKTFLGRNNILPFFIVMKIEHSISNDMLKVIKIQNLGALENFSFEKYNV